MPLIALKAVAPYLITGQAHSGISWTPEHSGHRYFYKAANPARFEKL